MGKKNAINYFLKYESEAVAWIEYLESLRPMCGYPIYSSMDIRDSGWKIAAVDVNLFPAGFNNLCPEDLKRGAKAFEIFLTQKLSKVTNWKLALVPEAHTSNQGYLENLSGLLKMLETAGAKVSLVWPGPAIPKPWIIKTKSGAELKYLPAVEALNGVDAVILNHDLSGGIPKILNGLGVPIFPSTKLGWYRRRKSSHADIVNGLLRKLKEAHPNFDPWYFEPASERILNLNLETTDGFNEVKERVRHFFEKLESEYKSRQVEEQPYVYMKNDAGTYGMGVVPLRSYQELDGAQKWLASKMKKGKEAVPVTQLILQEGIPTAYAYMSQETKKIVAGEPVVYLVNGSAIGGFMRLHETLGEGATLLNLNQPGSKLVPLSCTSRTDLGFDFPKLRGHSVCEEIQNFGFYAFLARLHSVAAGLEDCPA